MSDSKQEFAKRLKLLHVDYPGVQKTWSMLDSMRAHQKIGDKKKYPRHLFLIGHSGTGKSHLINKYQEANPGYVEIDIEGTEIDIRPVVVIEMPNPFTVMEFYQSLVRGLGAPTLMGKKTIGDVKRQAFTLIEKQKVEMIILDEMNYIVKSRAIKGEEAMEIIKHVANTGGVSLVCVGTPVIESLRLADFQYIRRYPVIRLERFKEFDQSFIDFLGQIEAQIKPPVPLGLNNPDTYLPQLLHEWSRGVIGLVIQIIIEGYRLTGLFNKLDGHSPEMTLEDLEQAKNNIYGDLLDTDLDLLLLPKATKNKGA